MIVDHYYSIPVVHLDLQTSQWLLNAVFPANRDRLTSLLASHGVYLAEECDHEDNSYDSDEGPAGEDHQSEDEGEEEEEDEDDDELEEQEYFQGPGSLDFEWCMMRIQELDPALYELLDHISYSLLIDFILYETWFVNPFRACNSLKIQLENGELGNFEDGFERIEDLERLLGEFVIRIIVEEKECTRLMVFCKRLHYFFKLLHNLRHTLCDGFGYVDKGHGFPPTTHELPLR